MGEGSFYFVPVRVCGVRVCGACVCRGTMRAGIPVTT